jgi:pyruvate kinase
MSRSSKEGGNIVEETRTKIVCTIGPASRDEKTLRALIRAGMDVARINFSHGTLDEHAQEIATIRRLADEEKAPVAVMADLQGPKLRVGVIKNEPLLLRQGDRITLTTKDATGEDNVVNLPHPELIHDVSPNDQLLLDDGALEFRVEDKTADSLVCRVVVGGELRSHKGVAAPHSALSSDPKLKALTPKDKTDARFALKQGVDFIALSFVRGAADIETLRSLVRKDGGSDEAVGIIAKIERREALEEFDQILETVDGVMVARGDLGVEVSVQEVPLYQKEIIRKCNLVGKPVITATQMLQSMIDNPIPTRAEASDVANAILDGTDAVMLSAESATGRYPVRAVEMMARISATVEEKMLNWVDDGTYTTLKHLQPITDAISDAAARIAGELGARLIATSTWTGYTARQIARERPREPIFALTPNEATYRRLALTWGVTPLLGSEYEGTDEMLQAVCNTLTRLELAQTGDLIVITAGVPLSGGGRTNLLKVHRL